MRIGGLQMVQPLQPFTGVGMENRFLKIQRRVLQALCDGKALAFGKAFALREQPRACRRFG